MIRLDLPAHQFSDIIELCLEGIVQNKALYDRLNESKIDLLAVVGTYPALASAGGLYTISATPRGNPDTRIAGTLTKSDLMAIYSSYFSKQDKPARKIYDAIMSAAREKCPFCGGIGKNKTLDHYLPKSGFSQFSVLPANLIPACRDCNVGEKLSAAPTRAEEQVIQPYFDHDRYFKERWIAGVYHPSAGKMPARCEYFALPPPGWPVLDATRAINHFKAFDLSVRYETQANTILQTLDGQIAGLKNMGMDSSNIAKVLLSPELTKMSFVNHWMPVLHVARRQALLAGG